MTTNGLLHQLIIGQVDLQNVILTLTDNLRVHLTEQNETKTLLRDCLPDVELLASVLNIATRRRSEGQDLSISTAVFEEMNLHAVMPLVKKVNSSDGQLAALLEPLYTVCCEHFELEPNARNHWLVMSCVDALYFDGSQPHHIISTRRSSLESLNCLIFLTQNNYPSMRRLLKNSTDDIIQNFQFLLESEHLAKFTIVVKKLLTLQENSENEQRLRTIWDVIESNETGYENGLLLLCTLADFYLGTDDFSVEIYNQPGLWKMVQSGLSSTNTLSRKRALYVLKRVVDTLSNDGSDQKVGGVKDDVAVFDWSSEKKAELVTVWEDYILITEMMEEKQVHVIRPLLPRWQGIVAACAKEENLNLKPLFHTSWLLVLLKRASVHSSGVIVKWGLEQLLDLDAKKTPLISQNGNLFMTSELGEILNQSVHYQRDLTTPLATCPPIAERLVEFLTNYWSAFGEDCQARGEFFRSLLESLDHISWSGIPLMFVMRAFSKIPKHSMLDTKSLDVLRNICSKHIRTVYVNQRGATQVFATQMMMNLIDTSKTTLLDVVRFLVVIKPEESFTRGSRVWKQLCDWLKTEPWTDTREQLEAMIRALLGKEKDSVFSELSPESLCLGFAKMFYLCQDCQLVSTNNVGTLLYPLFDTAGSACERLYLNRQVADNALLTIVKIIEQKGSLDWDPAFETMLGQSRRSLLEYTSQRLLASTSLDECDVYLSTLDHVIRSADAGKIPSLVADISEKMLCNVDKIKSTESDQLTCGLMAIRGLDQCISVLRNHSIENGKSSSVSYEKGDNNNFKLPTKLPAFSQLFVNVKRPSDSNGSVNGRDWNAIVSSAMEAQWRLVAYNIEYQILSIEGSADCLIDRCLAAIDQGTNATLESIFLTFEQIFSSAENSQLSADTVSHCITVCWRRLLECGSSPQAFWPAYKVFIRMCYQKTLTRREDILEKFVSLADEIQNAAVDRNGIMYELAERWTSQYPEIDLNPYMEHIVKMAMFGPVHKKGEKIVQDMNAYIAAGVEDLEPGMEESSREDYLVRVRIALFLTSLDRSDEKNLHLLRNFAEVAMETWREITRTKKRRHTFVNSLRHRETHRLLTSLLLIRDVIMDNIEETHKLTEFLVEVLEEEGQPSVRFLVEWMLILVMLKYDSKWTMIWENLSSRDDKKPAIQCSWLVILSHVARLIPASKRTDYLLKAIPTVLPLCMAHQFNPRIFGQACLMALYEQCHQEGLEKFGQVSLILDSVHNFMEMSGNASRCTLTLLDHFSLAYHPVEDLCFEVLYETVPRLFCMSQDELLAPSVFEENYQGFRSKDLPWREVPLRSAEIRRQVLEKCQPGAWKLRTDDSEAIDVTVGDVQRKITPWKRMLPDDEDEAGEFATLSSRRDSNTGASGGLILVASLIDKPANLGGLCRTCEIFGASEFVIGSLAYVNDPQFTGLSVTAQKWIPITEVQPNFVRDYLLMQQRYGYTLVGVEQTNNSRCLTEFTFPEKTLLVLGNEKEGIPVDLIQLLDVCVEIPQQGVVRSLNVHVSGALLMWEYRRQQLVKNS